MQRCCSAPVREYLHTVRAADKLLRPLAGRSNQLRTACSKKKTAEKRRNGHLLHFFILTSQSCVGKPVSPAAQPQMSRPVGQACIRNHSWHEGQHKLTAAELKKLLAIDNQKITTYAADLTEK